MALPVRLDFYAKQGDSFRSDPIQWRRGDTPVDLTNLAGKCQVRNIPQGGLIAELTVVKDDAVNGWYHIEASRDVMTNIPTAGATVSDYTKYIQDVQFSFEDYQETVSDGFFYVAPEVTRNV